jgi:hypothetical protein
MDHLHRHHFLFLASRVPTTLTPSYDTRHFEQQNHEYRIDKYGDTVVTSPLCVFSNCLADASAVVVSDDTCAHNHGVRVAGCAAAAVVRCPGEHSRDSGAMRGGGGGGGVVAAVGDDEHLERVCVLLWELLPCLEWCLWWCVPRHHAGIVCVCQLELVTCAIVGERSRAQRTDERSEQQHE